MNDNRTAGSTRLVALDAFRGLAMLLMVLVNDGGGPRSYGQLEHADWHGWTLTDCVFPSFLWIVGVAITLSLGKRLQSGVTRGQLIPQIARRAVTLYVLGCVLYLLPYFDFAHARFLGVLPRIAICYFIASLLYLFTGVRGQILTIAIVFALYSGLMYLYPVPGYGAGNWTVEGNFAHYIDHMVLGQHNYHETKTWDPEGIVSTLPAIGTAVLGLLAGHVLRLGASLTKRIQWLALIGAVLLPSALILNTWMPINKKLWTCTFALLMAGLDYLLLSLFLWLIDVRGYQKIVRPLVIVGRNSIAIYVASELLAVTLFTLKAGGGQSLQGYLYDSYFAPIGSVENASLLWALAFTAVMYLLAYGLYRRNWFFRI